MDEQIRILRQNYKKMGILCEMQRNIESERLAQTTLLLLFERYCLFIVILNRSLKKKKIIYRILSITFNFHGKNE